MRADGEVYDPVSDKWLAAVPMTTARAGHTATLLQDGDVLVTGGCATSMCDPTLSSSERWRSGEGFRAATAMMSARHHHTAERMGDGSVVVAGGCAQTGCLANAEAYDAAGDRWLDAGKFTIERGFHAETMMDDGRMLIAGGCNGNTCIPYTELFTGNLVDGGVPVRDGGGAKSDAGTQPHLRPPGSAGCTAGPAPGRRAVARCSSSCSAPASCGGSGAGAAGAGRWR